MTQNCELPNFQLKIEGTAMLTKPDVPSLMMNVVLHYTDLAVRIKSMAVVINSSNFFLK